MRHFLQTFIVINVFVFFLGFESFSQKNAYIPAYLLDTNTVDGHQFTWSKTLESANFIVIWGDSSGLNPLNTNDPDLVFNPQMILDTMEWIYQKFELYGFLDDSPGTHLSQYKVPIIMLNTFGPNGSVGWAFGGDADGVMGCFWAHPLAMQSGHVAAHEFTHSMQAQSVIDARVPNGLGDVWINSGIFWETHANFMRNLIYPQDVTANGMDVTHIETFGDWKNTYENYPVLFSIMETDGIEIVNRLWRESYSEEYPLQTYKRLMGYTQSQFNDRLFDYAKRMANFDFSTNNVGQYFRQYRSDDLTNHLETIQSVWTILDQDSSDENHYSVPVYLAPEEYGYNVIPIHRENDSCPVIIKFKGHVEENPHSGWRFGFAAVKADGTISRYSPTYNQNTQVIAFQPEADETEIYFIVMGAPFDEITTNTTNDTWKGYPKHFRYAYDLYMTGGKPEGHQASAAFRSQLKTDGAIHSNGGGWVANSASVSPSVYVGEKAIVLGSSVLTGNVQVKGTSVVVNAIMSDSVLVDKNAFVIEGNASGNAVISGQAYASNNVIYDHAKVHMRARVSNYTLHGNIEVGGDVVVYNTQGNCDNGVYYRMTNYYEDNLLECDHRDANHPENSDVNSPLTAFALSELITECDCNNYVECTQLAIDELPENSNCLIYPNPFTERIECVFAEAGDFGVQLTDMTGRVVFQHHFAQTSSVTIPGLQALANGNYMLRITGSNGQQVYKLKK